MPYLVEPLAARHVHRTPAGQALDLALVFPSLALIGGIALGHALRMEAGAPLRKICFSVGFTVLVLAILDTGTLNVIRGIDAMWLEERQRASFAVSDDLNVATTRGAVGVVYGDKRLLGHLFAVTSVAMGAAGELGSAYVCDQPVLLLIPVWTVMRLRRRVHDLEAGLVENAVAEERSRHQPDLPRALVATEIIEAHDMLRQPEAELPPPTNDTAGKDAEDESLAPLARKLLDTILAIALGLLVVIGSRAHSAEPLATHTVILLDLSSSAVAQEEFAKNLIAVDELLARIAEDGGQQVAIFGITEVSFATPPLLVSTGPREAGWCGEYLDPWRRAVLTDWREVRARLSPSANGSDLFGALARAALEFEESDARTKGLIFLSDMRQVGRGADLERAIGNPSALVDLAERQGFIPKLAGIEVAVLGAHSAGVDERQWSRLRMSWSTSSGRRRR